MLWLADSPSLVSHSVFATVRSGHRRPEVWLLSVASRQFVWAVCCCYFCRCDFGFAFGLAPASTPSLLTLPAQTLRSNMAMKFSAPSRCRRSFKHRQIKHASTTNCSGRDCYASCSFIFFTMFQRKIRKKVAATVAPISSPTGQTTILGTLFFPQALAEGHTKPPQLTIASTKCMPVAYLISPSSSIFDKFPLTVDGQEFQVQLSLIQNPFETTDEICTKFALLHDDCITFWHSC